MHVSTAQDRRFAAIAAASAAVLGTTEYHSIRTADVAARVRLEEFSDRRSSGGARSAVWLYNEVHSRRVLVVLGAQHAWDEFLAHSSGIRSTKPPVTVSEAIALVSRSLERIARFHQTERFLLEQVARGIGDISTSEKAGRSREQAPIQWPESSWSDLARSGYEGRCTIYADSLAPILLKAAENVAPLGVAAAAAQAAALSDLVFRGLVSAPEGPTERIAAGFAAYWFERDLVPAAGRWVRDLHAAELAVASVVHRDSGWRAEQSARGSLIKVLMDADTLHARSAREGATRTAVLQTALGWLAGDGADGAGEAAGQVESWGSTWTAPAEVDPMSISSLRDIPVTDLRDLCDASSRHGLALLRFGNAEQAVRAFQASRTAAAGGFAGRDENEARSFEARAAHNLAEAAMSLGDRSAALDSCEHAFGIRSILLAEAENASGGEAASAPETTGVLDAAGKRARRERAAAGRRYLLTAELKARVTAWAGRPVEACALAQDLERRFPAGFLGRDAGATAARLRGTLGEVLFEAGHPVEARHHLEAARLFYSEDRPGLAVGLPEYRDRMRLARTRLLLGEHAAADDLLPDEETIAWCADHVSFRTAAEARRLRALALSGSGSHDEAIGLITAALAGLRGRVGDPATDASTAELERTRAVILVAAGRPETALGILKRLRTAWRSRPAGQFGPPAAATLLWLARTVQVLGDPRAASGFHAELTACAAGALEPTHPLLLEAGLDQADRLIRSGDFDAATGPVELVLDDRVLAHGRPCVEKGHPLRTRAYDLADALGVRPAPHRFAWDEF